MPKKEIKSREYMSKRRKCEITLDNDLKTPQFILPPSFQEYYGLVGNVLAETLLSFSLDIVGLVADYLLCPVAKSKSIPHLQLTMIHQVCGPSYITLNVHPIHHTIWLIRGGECMVMDDQGKILFNIARNSSLLVQNQLFVACGFSDQNDEAYLSTDTYYLVTVRSENGEFLKNTPPKSSFFRHCLYGLYARNDKLYAATAPGISVYNKDTLEHLNTWEVDTSSGTLYVSQCDQTMATTCHDDKKGCIKVLDLNGHLLKQIGPCLNTPWSLIRDRNQQWIVGDAMNQNVYVLSEHGEIVTHFKTPSYPYTLCIDGQGKLWVGCSTCVCIYTW